MNPLSEYLELMRFKASIYHNARICGDWLLNAHNLGATCFHLPMQGRCGMKVPGHGEWILEEGDVVIFPKELPHTLYTLDKLEGDKQHLSIAESQAIDGTSMICGAIRFKHQGAETLLKALPEVMVVQKACAARWVSPITDLLLKESLAGASNDSIFLNRLSELLFCYAIRCYSDSQQQPTGLLALYANQQLQRAVEAIHRQPEKPWTLASLAVEAAMSRTVFSEKFNETAQMTVMQYLSWWRMQLAWAALSEGKPIADVAERVGYGSEAAFSRAFKTAFGLTAGRVRRGEY